MLMKKLVTLILVLAGIVGTASADSNMWLRSNLTGGSWTENITAYQFTKTWDGTQDVYELSIPASLVPSSQDIWFRLYRGDTDYEVCPYQKNNYKFVFTNGHDETYNAVGDDFHGNSGAFHIEHTTIKASNYKVTVYLKYNTPWEYYIKVDIVDMPVTISSAGMATFTCGRALDFNGTGIAANIITSANAGALTTEAVTKVPANTGLFLEGDEGTVNVPVITSSEAESVDVSANMLVAGTGATVPQTDGAGNTNFILTTNKGASATPKFFKVNTDGNTVAVGKAYLQIPSAYVGAHEYFWFEDETTGIEAVKASQKMNGEFFNLAGQRVAQPAKGLYIVNGKKVIMK